MYYYQEEYPDYLTNDNIFDDLKYLWNKQIFIKQTVQNIVNTIRGIPSTSFDDYGIWGNGVVF